MNVFKIIKNYIEAAYKKSDKKNDQDIEMILSLKIVANLVYKHLLILQYDDSMDSFILNQFTKIYVNFLRIRRLVKYGSKKPLFTFCMDIKRSNLLLNHTIYIFMKNENDRLILGNELIKILTYLDPMVFDFIIKYFNSIF